MEAKPKILIVDDKLENRVLIEKLLQSLDVEFFRARTGQEALTLLAETEIAIALVDVKMPKMNGFQLVEHMRQNPRTASIPVIFISAVYSSDMHKTKGIQSGAVDFITKPFVSEILLGKVRNFLFFYEQRREIEQYRDHLEDLVDERTAELKRINQQLRVSQQQQNEILNNSPTLVYLKDLQGHYLLVNKRYAELFNTTNQAMYGKTDYDIFPKETADAFTANDLEVINSRSTMSFEEIARQDDGPHTYYSTKFPLYNENGDLFGVCGMSMDITSRKMVERDMHESERRFRTIVTNAQPIIFQIDLDGIFTLSEGKMLASLGLEPGQVVGLSAYDVYKDYPRILDAIKRAMSGETYIDTLAVKGPHGDVHFEIFYSPDFNNADEIIGIIGMAIDVTDRVLAEERVRHLNQVLMAIRNVNQLIVREKNVDRLLTGVCECMTESRGYDSAWVVLLDKNDRPTHYAENGIGPNFQNFIDHILTQGLAPCAQMAYVGNGVSTFSEPQNMCEKVPLNQTFCGQTAKIVKLIFQEKIYGLLAVSVSSDFPTDVEEDTLVQEVADDIAFALHSLNIECERQQERGIFISGPAVIFKWQNAENWPVEYVSPNVEYVLGYSTEAFMAGHISYASIIHSDDLQRVARFVEQSAAGNVINFSHEPYRVMHKDGHVVWLADYTTIIRDHTGTITHYLGYILDISRTKQAEEDLKREKSLLRTIVDSVPDLIFYKNTKGVYSGWNKAFEKFIGRTEAEIIGTTDADLFPAAAVASIKETDRLLFTSGKPQRREEWVNFSDGRRILLDTRTTPLFDSDGVMFGLVGISRDITDRHEAEKIIRDSELRFKALSNSTFEGLLFSEKGICTDANLSACRMFGYTYDELIGMFGTDAIAPESKELVKKNMLAGYEEPYEAVAQRKDGTTFPAELHGKMFEHLGKTVRVTAVRDITRRKQAEAALRESEMNLRTLIENSRDAIGVSKHGVHIMVNPAYLEIFGYDNGDELLGEPILKLIAPSEHDRVIANVKKRDTGESAPNAYETLGLRKDGTEFDMDVRVSNYTVDGAVHTQVILRDITERKRAQRALQESEEKFRVTTENSADAILLMDRDARFSYVNQQACALLGYSRDELLNLSILDISPKEKYETYAEMFGKLTTSGNLLAEIDLLKKDGKRIPVDINAILLPNGLSYASCRDITQRKRAESTIRASLKEKETLLKELYHRTKNNMQVIISMMGIQSIYSEDEQVSRAFEDMEHRIRSMALVHQKLYQSQNLSSVDLRDYITDLVDQLMASHGVMPDNVDVVYDLNPVPVALDTAVPCGLVINELLTNIMKYAFPDGRKGMITIRLDKTPARICLYIADNGVGASPNFDFRQSDSMGLQTVISLVENQLSGSIQLDTRVGLAWTIEFNDPFDKRTSMNGLSEV